MFAYFILYEKELTNENLKFVLKVDVKKINSISDCLKANDLMLDFINIESDSPNYTKEMFLDTKYMYGKIFHYKMMQKELALNPELKFQKIISSEDIKDPNTITEVLV